MKEKIKILVAYCSEAFKENVLPLIVHYTDKSNRTELKFECDRVGPQDEWDKLLDGLMSGDFTHFLVDRKLHGYMTPNQYKNLKRKAYNAKVIFKLQSPNGGLKQKEIKSQIADFFVPNTKITSDVVRGKNGACYENEDD